MSSHEVILLFLEGREIQNNLRGCKTVEGGMRTYKVEEKRKNGNEVVSGVKGAETLFGLVPGLELLVESLKETVGDIVFEGLDSDVVEAKRLGRLFVGGIAVCDKCDRLAGQRSRLTK